MSENLDNKDNMTLTFPVSAKMREMLEELNGRALMGEMIRQAYDHAVRLREYEKVASDWGQPA